MRGLIVHVEDRINFGDFERHHFLRVCDHLHRKVRFAVIGASADWSRYSRRFIWVEEVRVKSDGVAVRASCHDGYRFIHHRSDPASIDLFHREHADSRLFYEFAFLRIDFADPDLNRMLRLDLRREYEDLRELDRTIPHDGCHRHSMNVSARRNFGSVEISMGIKPHQSDLLALPSKTFCNSG